MYANITPHIRSDFFFFFLTINNVRGRLLERLFQYRTLLRTNLHGKRKYIKSLVHHVIYYSCACVYSYIVGTYTDIYNVY